MNTIDEFIIDTLMAGGTGGRNIGIMSGCPFVLAVQDIVTAVTSGTHRTG